MRVVHARCAGLDVHKKSVYACVICREAKGRKKQEVRTFGTVTAELLKLSDWLRENEITHVAIEATGVYWRPVWAVLAGQYELMLVNPHHIKEIPGRKTDAQDCEWIADLLQHGLIRGSFVPPTEIQVLLDLTRYRAELTQAQNRVDNRMQKLLEQCNIKLSSVGHVQVDPDPAPVMLRCLSGGGAARLRRALARTRSKPRRPLPKQP